MNKKVILLALKGYQQREVMDALIESLARHFKKFDFSYEYEGKYTDFFLYAHSPIGIGATAGTSLKKIAEMWLEACRLGYRLAERDESERQAGADL